METLKKAQSMGGGGASPRPPAGRKRRNGRPAATRSVETADELDVLPGSEVAIEKQRLSMPGISEPDDSRKMQQEDKVGEAAGDVVAQAEAAAAAEDTWVDPETKAWMSKLKRACVEGDLSLLHRVLEYADVNTQLSGGWPPLSLAAAAGHAGVVRELLKAGADAKTGASPASPLELAASAGRIDCVQLLLTYSTHQQLADACQQAAAGGHLDAVRRLLDFESTLLYHLNQVALENICVATEAHELELGEVRPKLRVWYRRLKARFGLFVSLEAACKDGDVEALRSTLKNPGWQKGDLDRCFRSGWTALGLAAAGGHTSAVRLLLGAGASLRAKMADGSDPMSVAMVNGEDDVISELMALAEKAEDEAKDKAKAKFKNLNARAVNKNREKESLISRIRAGEDDTSKVPWYKVPGGQPPRVSSADVVSAMQPISAKKMKKKKKLKREKIAPEYPLEFQHGVCGGLVSAIAHENAVEAEMRRNGGGGGSQPQQAVVVSTTPTHLDCQGCL